MREIVFAEHRGSVGAAVRPQGVELARFKDENIATPRVVAASRDYIVYSLKNRASLRVLPRKAAPGPQLAYKQHTDVVTAAMFVNARSNIVASSSAAELLVWYIDDDGAIYTYFTFHDTVTSFAWVPTANQPPDLLVLLKRGQTKEAAILKSSTLILKSAPEAGGTIRKPDGTLVAELSHLTSLKRDLICEVAHTGAASPIIAYSVSDDSIVTASLANLQTPAWQPCQGEKVTHLCLQPNELLIAVSDRYVYIWDVAGEPIPLQRFALGNRRCTAIHSTIGRATLFLTTGVPGTSEAVCLMMQPKIGATATAFYDVSAPVTPINSCSITGPSDEPRLHVDSANVLQVFFLQEAPWNPLDAAVADASPKAKSTPKPVQSSPPVFSSPNVAAARPVAAAPRGGRSDLPASAEIEALKSHIEAAIANTASMMNVAKSVVTKDHEALMQEALKAQARVLASSMPATKVAAGPAANAFDAVIEGITEPVAAALVDGISAAIEDQLRLQLETALRQVLTRQEKKKQRDSMSEIAKNLDTVVADVMSQVVLTVQQKQSAYASRLIHYVSDVCSEGWTAAQQLQNIIAAQQQQLSAITQSGLLDEVKRLRAEVAELKRRNNTGARTETADLPRETVLANAQTQLASGNHVTGLSWILHFNDPAALMQLLNGCNEETRDAMLDDSAVTSQLWAQIAVLLTSTPKKETLEPTLEWLCDILGVKSDLTKNDQLMVSIGSFLDAWKGANLSQEAKNKLRQLMMLVRR